MTFHALHVNPAVPAGAQDLGDSTRIVSIGLVAHGRQRGGDLACLQADGFEAGRLQAIAEVLRQRAGFEADGRDVLAEGAQAGHYLVDLRNDLASCRISPLSSMLQIETERSETSKPV